MSDLWAQERADRLSQASPLADRMRPVELDDVVGQEPVLGQGSLLRRLIVSDRMGSVLLWGPPGTGKTTVARLYGRILNELGFLSRGDVVLATPSDFVGSALGQSEEKTNALLDKARGCVLVIDEAYGLDPSSGNGNGAIAGGDPFRGAVVDALVSRVQGEAGADVCVLLLGYERPMREFLRIGRS